MERNGDVIAELNRCNSFNYSLLNNSYNPDKYKMCKDDIVTPLFCSASDCLSKSIIMGSEHKSAESYLNSDDENINLFSARRNYVSNDDYNMPVIESSVDSIQDCCDSPIWEKPPILQSFSPVKVENLKTRSSFMNGNKLITDNKVDLYKNVSISTVDSVNEINDKLLLDYEAETSSSSTEELDSCPEIKELFENNNTLVDSSEVDSNHNIKISPGHVSDENNDLLPSPYTSKLPEISKNIPNSPVKSDRAMPELIPSLICLDSESSCVSENKKEQCEVIDVADSPEMPTLIPFTSERDEIFQVKTECISEDEKPKDDDTDSQDSEDENFQPQVLLRRLSVNNVSKEDVKSNVLFKSVNNSYYKFITGSPEIEEIEGVRFFQFRSKKEMEEFNRKPAKIEADEDMIIPTKTNDITQIKGWRTKYFAPESQFHLQAFELDGLKPEDSNQGDKITANHLNEAENKNDKKELHSETPTSESKKSPTHTKCNVEESCEDKNDHLDDSSSDSEEDEKKTRFKKIKDEGNKNPLSAFVSDELERYLLTSSTLNISFLQKVNPNIVPISPDAKILSIGKLRKRDGPPLPPHLVFKRKSELFKLENDSAESVITLDDSPGSPNIITLESSEESDEDVPVAKLLKSKKKIPIKRENSKSFKRNLESEYDTPAKRVVLRLTKEGSGISKGYKVSDISCKKEKSVSTSRASSPSSNASSLDLSQDIVEVPSNGSLPIIKKTLFSEKNERRLVSEFLNNLNMYGTRKDVAMLVQSNQSYFDDGPTLTGKICAKAVSVLVSNKEYFEEKQKSKKKLKTWQKYLPKKIDKQNMKMKLSKRKSRIEKLLDDAESMIPAERGKRSIRLPARYLDSAVLAASEWVSPVITIDDNVPNKSKQETTVETLDKGKLNEENCIVISSPSSKEISSSSSENSSEDDSVDKAAIKLPQKRSVKMKKIPVQKKKLKDSQSELSVKADSKKVINQTKNSKLIKAESSTSSSSDEDNVIEPINKKIYKNVVVNNKITPGKRKKNETSTIKNSNSATKSIKKSLPDEIVTNKQKKSKETSIKAQDKEVVLPFSSDVNSKSNIKTGNIMDLSEGTGKVNTIPRKNKNASSKYKIFSMPDCCCKHSARTAVFDYISKEFSCAFCDSMKKFLFNPDSKKLESNSHAVFKNQGEESCKLLEASAPEKLNSVKMASEKAEIPVLTEPPKSQLNISDISTSIPISFANQFRKQEPKIQTVNQSVASSTVPSSNVPNKYILLLKPLKTAANANTVPMLPIHCEMSTQNIKTNQSPVSDNRSPTAANPVFFNNNKNKPPILIRKTSTGLITQNSFNDSSSYNFASNKLMKMAENTSSQLSNSLVGLSRDSSDKSSQGLKIINSESISNANSSTVPPSLVTAYKVGDNVYICNTPVPTAKSNSFVTNNAVSSVESKHFEGPVITSVQSIQPDAIEKNSEDTKVQNEIPKQLNTLVNQHHNYHKKKRHNRRKSPLIPLNYDEGNKKDVDEGEEVDIETVDETCNVLIKKKPAVESDSEVSDNECASIFLSSADKLRSVYSKKSIKERQRRLQIKSGFENLKLSSRGFKKAGTCIEILDMAVTVVNAQKKTDKVFCLAKKRLKIHNSMLMGKLSQLIEDIEPTSVRNKTKMQIIKALALDQCQNKKSVLPLLSEGYKGCALNSDTERKKPNSDAHNTEAAIENVQSSSPPPVLKQKAQVKKDSPPIAVEEKNYQVPLQVPSPQPPVTEAKGVEKIQQDDTRSVEAISSDEVQKLDMKPAPDGNKEEGEIILKSPKDVNISPRDSPKMKVEGLKQKVKEALEKNDKEEISDSDTEELGSDSFNLSGISDDDFDLKICTEDTNSTDLSVTPENQTPSKEYPGLIPLFHPKVLKENCSPSQSPLPPTDAGESSRSASAPSSRRKSKKSNIQGTVPEIQIDDDDDDDDIAILNPADPSSSASGKWESSSSKDKVELAVAAKTANKLFGPCTVQKVHLKNGQTVFAYQPEKTSTADAASSTKSAPSNKPALQTNANGVRNLREVFNAFSTKNRTPSRKELSAPEEIVLLDSSDDEETETKSDSTPRTSQDSSSSKKSACKDKKGGDPKQVDKTDSQNESSSSL